MDLQNNVPKEGFLFTFCRVAKRSKEAKHEEGVAQTSPADSTTWPSGLQKSPESDASHFTLKLARPKGLNVLCYVIFLGTFEWPGFA